ncbi:bestrophin family protein [Pedobacter sp. MW01-1-1]|uniref:bestrophin family protein n=1 Tax=Pedobacter sp. MW01-1-1 TaxID=3383027 RepID=UPI003FEF9398
MINYNSKAWFAFIFHFHKSDTIRQLWPIILIVAIFSGGIAYLELEVFHLSKNSYVTNLGMMHTALSMVISLLLVFRTSSAYDRWWEGRKLLGSLVNVSRNFAMKVKALNLPEEDMRFYEYGIPKYGFALKEHLREKKYFGKNSLLIEVEEGKHIPNQIASSMITRMYELHRKGLVSAEQLIFLTTDLNQFTDICGACERIRNTPIPFSYSTFIKKFIFTYVATLPIGWVFNLGYSVIFIVPFILYVLASLELIAEEIENPFGYDANDLPVDKITANIEKHVEEIFSLPSQK